MDEHLTRFAEKASRDPDFFAHTLRVFSEANGLDETGLRERLGIDAERLLHLKLCRTPRLDPEGFRTDTHRLAEAFAVDEQQLAWIVREVAVTVGLQEAAEPTPAGIWSLAARDRPPPAGEENST
jgi:hypothetical protein